MVSGGGDRKERKSMRDWDTQDCELCGEKLDNTNWLPEGQCFCDECAAECWQEEYEEEDEDYL